MSDDLCPTCGAKTVKYKHRLTPPLVEGLKKLLAAGGGPINLKDLDLTRNQWDNFQKLRYFGLVLRAVRDDGTRRNGFWVITVRGRAFLSGNIAIPEHVVTYRGEQVAFEGDPVRVTEIVAPHYQQREQWAAEAQAVAP